MSCRVIRGPIWRYTWESQAGLKTEGCVCRSCHEPFLTSVSRTALCWAGMLPRPATAWGSSVILCSPSGSTSLSDSATPLWDSRLQVLYRPALKPLGWNCHPSRAFLT